MRHENTLWVGAFDLLEMVLHFQLSNTAEANHVVQAEKGPSAPHTHRCTTRFAFKVQRLFAFK